MQANKYLIGLEKLCSTFFCLLCRNSFACAIVVTVIHAESAAPYSARLLRSSTRFHCQQEQTKLDGKSVVLFRLSRIGVCSPQGIISA